jgi:hypothetical protein
MTTKPAKQPKTPIVEDGTPAAATIDNKPVHSRAELLAMAMANLAAMKPDDLSSFFYASIERKEAQPVGNDAGHNADTLSTHPSAASPQVHESLKADLKSLFEGQEVSPEFVEKAALLFEAAVSARVAVARATIEEEVQTDSDAKVEQFKTELAEKIDGYASYAADEWLEENRVATETSLTAELALDFMADLQEVFTKHNVTVPDAQVDVVEALTAKVEAVSEQLTAVIDDNIELSKQVDAGQMREAFAEIAQGLTDIQVQTFKGLTETVSFEGDIEDFKTKLKTIRESNFKGTQVPPKQTSISEEVSIEIPVQPGSDPAAKKNVDPSVAGLVGVLDRMPPRFV